MSTAVVCVVDASVAIKLYLAEPLAAEAHALFACLADPASAFHTPDLFYAECGNILWKQVQRGNCTPALAASHFTGITQLPLQRVATADVCANALGLAITHGITVYDACYVALAQRLGIPLVTADEKLVHKLANFLPSIVWLGSGTLPAKNP